MFIRKRWLPFNSEGTTTYVNVHEKSASFVRRAREWNARFGQAMNELGDVPVSWSSDLMGAVSSAWFEASFPKNEANV